jgi:hypothetical protein
MREACIGSRTYGDRNLIGHWMRDRCASINKIVLPDCFCAGNHSIPPTIAIAVRIPLMMTNDKTCCANVLMIPPSRMCMIQSYHGCLTVEACHS